MTHFPPDPFYPSLPYWIQLLYYLHFSKVTFSYTLLEVKVRKYSSLVLPENFPETMYVHIENIFSVNFFENTSSKYIFENIFGKNIIFETSLARTFSRASSAGASSTTLGHEGAKWKTRRMSPAQPLLLFYVNGNHHGAPAQGDYGEGADFRS